MDRYMGHQVKKKSKSIPSIDKETLQMMNKSKREGEKIFIRLVVDYICKNKTWEDLKIAFRPRGAMTQWTAETSELLGLKSKSNYDLNYSPPSSPTSSPKSKGNTRKKRSKKKTKKLSKKKRFKGKTKTNKTKRDKTKRNKT